MKARGRLDCSVERSHEGAIAGLRGQLGVTTWLAPMQRRSWRSPSASFVGLHHRRLGLRQQTTTLHSRADPGELMFKLACFVEFRMGDLPVADGLAVDTKILGNLHISESGLAQPAHLINILGSIP